MEMPTRKIALNHVIIPNSLNMSVWRSSSGIRVVLRIRDIFINIFVFIFQTSTDGNTTTSTLSFTPKKEDDGKNLSCRAENKVLSSDSLKDGWKLEIHCE